MTRPQHYPMEYCYHINEEMYKRLLRILLGKANDTNPDQMTFHQRAFAIMILKELDEYQGPA